MIKKLLIIICFLTFLTPVFATHSFESETLDNVSTISISPNINEVGLYSNITVRLLDSNKKPIPNHTVHIYMDEELNGINIIQPENPTDNDGYAIGKIRSNIQGDFTIKAHDNTFPHKISLLDSAQFTVFPISTPRILNEPILSTGLSNHINWVLDKGLGRYKYYAEVSDTQDFKTVISNSGWLHSNSYDFENLSSNHLYYYRVKAKNQGNVVSNWSGVVFSTQDNLNPVIKAVEIKRITTGDIFSGINVTLDVTDNYEIGEVYLTCKLKNDTEKICGTLERSGNRYYANIQTEELERNMMGGYLDKYGFCINAKDKAGNSNKNCEIEIDIASKISQKAPFLSSSINSIIRFINDNLVIRSQNLVRVMQDTPQAVLQFISLSFFLSTVILNLSLLSNGLYLISNFLRFRLIKTLKYFGLMRNAWVLGTVYDAITGRPIKYADVQVYDSSNNLVLSDITNENGNFFGSIDIGKYRLIVVRPHYLFPSEYYKEYGVQKYGKLNRGEFFIVNKKNPMNLAIPLDPINIYSEFEKKNNLEKKSYDLFRSLIFLFITLGLALTGITFGVYPTIFNLVLLFLYIPIIGIYLKTVIRIKI